MNKVLEKLLKSGIMSHLPEIHSMNVLCWAVEDQNMLWGTLLAP